MKRLLKPLDYIFVLRLTFFFPVWSLFLAGFYTQNKYVTQLQTFGESNHAIAQHLHELYLTGLLLTLLMGGIFILHQVMDRHVEKAYTFIAPEMLTPKAAFIEASIMMALALLGCFFLSIPAAVILVLLLLLSGYLYNFPPFNLKNNAIGGLVAITVSGLLIFLLGWLTGGDISRYAYVASVPYVLAVAAMYLLVSTLDVAKDNPQRKTFAIVFGKTVTAGLAVALGSAAMVVSFISSDELIFYPTFFSLPFLIWVVLRMNDHELSRVIKYPVMMFAVAISLKWILTMNNYRFVYVLLTVYFLSKLYHKLRFGIGTSTLPL